MATDDLFAEAIDDPGAPLDDAAGPGQPQLAPQQPRTQKPRSNVQTMMLILSLAAIVTSCVVLYLYLDQYGEYPWFELPPNVKSAISGA